MPIETSTNTLHSPVIQPSQVQNPTLQPPQASQPGSTIKSRFNNMLISGFISVVYYFAASLLFTVLFKIETNIKFSPFFYLKGSDAMWVEIPAMIVAVIMFISVNITLFLVNTKSPKKVFLLPLFLLIVSLIILGFIWFLIPSDEGGALIKGVAIFLPALIGLCVIISSLLIGAVFYLLKIDNRFGKIIGVSLALLGITAVGLAIFFHIKDYSNNKSYLRLAAGESQTVIDQVNISMKQIEEAEYKNIPVDDAYAVESAELPNGNEVIALPNGGKLVSESGRGSGDPYIVKYISKEGTENVLSNNVCSISARHVSPNFDKVLVFESKNSHCVEAKLYEVISAKVTKISYPVSGFMYWLDNENVIDQEAIGLDSYRVFVGVLNLNSGERTIISPEVRIGHNPYNLEDQEQRHVLLSPDKKLFLIQAEDAIYLSSRDGKSIKKILDDVYSPVTSYKPSLGLKWRADSKGFYSFKEKGNVTANDTLGVDRNQRLETTKVTYFKAEFL